MEEEELASVLLAEAPWLILAHDNDDEELGTHTFCTMDNKSYTKTISELRGKLILASSQGWLILQQENDSSKYSLWNPVTRQSLILPDLSDDEEGEEEEREYTCSILTSPPYGNDDDLCVLVLFFDGLLFWCKPTVGDEGCKWVKQSLELDGESVAVTHAAALNGGNTYVYALGSHLPRFLARVRVSGSSSTTMLLFEPLNIKPPDHGTNNDRTYQQKQKYLVEVSGELYAVHGAMRQLHVMDDYDIVKMYVWKLDPSEMEWIHVESLGGDRAVLLGDDCCTWCWADHSAIEGDCIYIIKSATRTMHQYRLQDDSYDFLLPSPHLLHQTSDTMWFMPRNPTRLAKIKMDVPLITEKLEDTDEKLGDMNVQMPTSSSSSICQLPSDMLIISLTKSLHLFDCMNLRASCKALRSKIPQSQWGSNKSSYPLFMSRKNNKDGICELWDPCQNMYHSRTVMTPHLSSYMISTIEFCKDGWLLLRIDGVLLQGFNPFEGKSYKYPSILEICCLSNIAFSTRPTLPDCLTVGICGYIDKVDIMYFQAGNERWEVKRIDLDDGIEFDGNYSCSPKYHEGSFYFLDVKGNLLVLKMADREWSWTVHKSPVPEDTTLNSCYLVELDAELVSVFIERLGRRVQVFRFDTLDEAWIVLQDLGDHMLFISPGSSLSVATKDRKMRNKIYLPKRIGNEMVFYSLDNAMYHTSSHQYLSKDFYGMRSHPFCCWL